VGVDPANICCVTSDCAPLAGGLVPRACQGGVCCVASGTVIGPAPSFLCPICLPSSVCCSGNTTGSGLSRRCL
jgi:hypothetical protein